LEISPHKFTAFSKPCPKTLLHAFGVHYNGPNLPLIFIGSMLDTDARHLLHARAEIARLILAK
jgi:hypothetical protein